MAMAFVGWATTSIVKSISFNRNCSGYLERAANANTVEIAKKELNTAILYLEKNDLTEDYTSIFFTTPDEDIGFWYNNLKASHAELESLPKDATALEMTNVLMKLRETLMGHGEKGSYVTVPDGLSRYPNNGIFFFWGWSTFIGAFIFIIISMVVWDRNY